LVDNANKYRKPGSQIILNIYNNLELGHWSINISNEIVVGQKINKKNIVRKYYREPHSRNQSGSGLGLYLVKGFMPMLNGTMNVEIDDKIFVVKLNFFGFRKTNQKTNFLVGRWLLLEKSNVRYYSEIHLRHNGTW